jgi:hypothetical protein
MGREVIGRTRVSRVGGRKGGGFISKADQQDGIASRPRELGVAVAEWCHDEDSTGGNLQRPEWERVMARLLDPAGPIRTEARPGPGDRLNRPALFGGQLAAKPALDVAACSIVSREAPAVRPVSVQARASSARSRGAACGYGSSQPCRAARRARGRGRTWRGARGRRADLLRALREGAFSVLADAGDAK